MSFLEEEFTPEQAALLERALEAWDRKQKQKKLENKPVRRGMEHAMEQIALNLPSLHAELKCSEPVAAVAVCRLYNALSVMVLDERIRAFLIEHDPKALEQAESALHD